jgi:Putative peptidoglycan binding domain
LLIQIIHRKAALLLAEEERTLSVMRHIALAIPTGDRWHPIFARYLGQIADRVRGFGGDPERIDPSPDGEGKGVIAPPAVERFFIGFFSHGGIASVKNFPGRFVSPADNYAYKQSEIAYEYYLHTTRPPAKGFVQGQRNPPDQDDAKIPGDLRRMAWNVDDATGLVLLNTSYQLSVPPFTETPTNDGCVKVYAVGQRASVGQRARFYYNGAPNMDPKVVREIQQALADRGHDPGPIDGFYGEKTARAVVSFQLANGLVADGEVGPKTAEALGIEL